MGEEPEHTLFHSTESKALADAIGVHEDRMLDCLKRELVNNNWVREPALVAAMEVPMMRLCARYLYLEKRRGFALNPVGKCSRMRL